MTAIDCLSWKFASALPCTLAVYFWTLISAVVTIAIAMANTIIATSVSVSVKPPSSRRSRLQFRRLSIESRRVGGLGHAGAEVDRDREGCRGHAVEGDRVEDLGNQGAARRRRGSTGLRLAGRVRVRHAAETGLAGSELRRHRDDRLVAVSGVVRRGDRRHCHVRVARE